MRDTDEGFGWGTVISCPDPLGLQFGLGMTLFFIFKNSVHTFDPYSYVGAWYSLRNPGGFKGDDQDGHGQYASEFRALFKV